MTTVSHNKISNPNLSAKFAIGGLFDQISTFEALWEGWVRVRNNGGSGGGDGVTITQFDKGARNFVSQLSHQLRAGRYAPGPVRRVFVPKKDGGERPLDIPCIRDRVIQAAAANALVPILEPEFEDSSFAYRPGRSVAHAVRRVVALRAEGYHYVVDGDIRRYFESVPHPVLITQLERYVDDPAFIDLVGLWLEHHSHTETGLPQGSPLSPILANLYLDDVDEAIHSRGIRLVRYADDFLLLCKSDALAAGAMDKMAELLAGFGLRLHPDKTRIVDFERGFRFLGHVFVRGMAWQEAVKLDTTPDEEAVQAAAAALAKWQEDTDAPAQIPDPATEAPTRGRWAPRQRVLYVLEPGRRLTTQGESFCVTEPESPTPIIRIPHQRLDRIELSQACQLDASALDLAAASDITILRIDGYGQAIGKWQGKTSGNPERHLAQCELTLSPDRRLEQARLIVGGRIRNQRVQLKRMGRTRPQGEQAKVTAKLAQMIRHVERKPRLSLEEIMGFEGAAAALYWPIVAQRLDQPALFGGLRKRRKGFDPLNCLMDVLAGLLMRDMTVAIERAGLHPGIGVLHTTQVGQDALVYDLVEAFRAPIMEACAFAMVGRGAITIDHFVQNTTGWKLTRDGWAIAIRQYEAWVQRPIHSPHSDQKVMWRGLFEEEALAFAYACEAKEVFTPYRMDW